MELERVEVKKVVWSPEKIGKDGKQAQPPTVMITLELADMPAGDIRQLLEFAQRGACKWQVSSLQREMAVA